MALQESCKNAAKVLNLYVNPRAALIIEALRQHKKLTVSELVQETGLIQTNVSNLLSKLKDAGIVRNGEQVKRFTAYSLNNNRIQVIKRMAKYF